MSILKKIEHFKGRLSLFFRKIMAYFDRIEADYSKSNLEGFKSRQNRESDDVGLPLSDLGAARRIINDQDRI